MSRHSARRLVASFSLVALSCSRTPEYDLVIRGAELLDGTGAAARRADVAVTGDRIATIGDLAKARAKRVVDATGKVVAPGFIDTQAQSGATLLVDGNGESHLRQGITTNLIGEGDSPALWNKDSADMGDLLSEAGIVVEWAGFEDYLKRLEARGTAVNVGSFTSINRLRRDVIGIEDRAATPEEQKRLEQLLADSMRGGSFGLSSALIYPPGAFARTDELVALAKVAAAHGGIYITHVRGESFRLKEAIAEAIRIGEEAALPVVVYHLKVAARANWGTMGEVIQLFEAARAKGQNVSATQYPYPAGGTRLAACLPGWAQAGGREVMLGRLKDPALRKRIRREVETTIDGWENLIAGSTFDGIQIASVPPETDQSVVGKRVGEIARERKQDPWDVFFDILLATDARTGALFHMMSEDDVRAAMAHSWISIGSDAAAIRHDGLLGRGQPHPRAYGTFPRVLGKYVRDEKVLPLATAIHKMTGFAAAQMQLRERGLVQPGYFADLVVFDPNTVADTATFEKPHQYPLGIETVVVNGRVTVENGRHTGARAGRALFGPGHAAAMAAAGERR